MRIMFEGTICIRHSNDVLEIKKPNNNEYKKFVALANEGKLERLSKNRWRILEQSVPESAAPKEEAPSRVSSFREESDVIISSNQADDDEELINSWD